MKKFFLIPLIVLFVVGLSFNGWAQSKSKIVPSGTLRVSMVNFGSETFDPLILNAVWLDIIHNTALTFTPQGEATGRVAESYSLSPDGKTWTFKIRKGVKFHNGDEVTSADFMFTFERFISPESKNPWANGLRRAFDRMEAPDAYTWVFHTKAPEPFLTASFANFHITPKNYIQKNGVDHFRKNPVGTGSWKFVKLISGTSLELEAVKDHWLLTPAFEKCIIDLVPEEATRIAKLKRGETDIAPVSLDRAAELKREGLGLQPMVLPSIPALAFPGTWLTKGPMSELKVRQALSFAINRQEIANTFFRGFAKPGGTWFLSESTWGWDPAWKPDPFDPNKAKELLKEAGYPGKFQDPVIKVYSNAPAVAPWLPDFMQILAGYWEAVGIKTKIEPVDWAQLNSMFFVRGSEGIVGTVVPYVTTGQPNNVYHCQNLYTSKGIHSTGNDPKLDALFNKLLVELDRDKAKALYREFQEYGRSIYIVIGTVQIFDQLGLSPKVGEFAADLHRSFQHSLAGIQHKK